MIIKKYYSQHYLYNKNIILKIINYLKLSKNKYDCILEIGPGLGYLSKELIKNFKNCLFVEIDKYLIKTIKKNIKKKIFIINKDILKLKLNKINKYKKFYIVGNFPYNISSKLLIWLIKNRKYISECLGTFQKEFINNLIYQKKYKSKLSIYFNMYFNINKLFYISNKNFYPIPKVNSIVVRITKKKYNYKNINIKKFLKIIKEAYKYKRKILKNSLKNILKKKSNYLEIIKYNIFKKRPEDLSIKDYIIIYKLLIKNV